jgi:hypothetical protein
VFVTVMGIDGTGGAGCTLAQDGLSDAGMIDRM